MPEEDPTARKIFVGGLPPQATVENLKTCFAEFGSIVDAVVMYDNEKDRPRGFGFVTFETEASVERVLSERPSYTLFDKRVEVKRAVPRRDCEPTERALLTGRPSIAQLRCCPRRHLPRRLGRFSHTGRPRGAPICDWSRSHRLSALISIRRRQGGGPRA